MLLRRHLLRGLVQTGGVFVLLSAPGIARAQDALVAIKAARAIEVHSPKISVEPIQPPHPRPLRSPLEDRSRRRFLLMSIGVYAAAFLDMQESVSLRPRFREQDPLARPFAELPVPAYYITGAAFATGINWVGLQMARSERWHRVWWLPQACSIAGNLFGFGYTKLHERPR